MKEESRFRLLKHINFLKNELKDYDTFKSLSWTEYDNDRHKRRDVERWVENIINSSIDISKIILNAEGKSLPDTYKEVIKSLCALLKFKEEDMNNLSELIRLRNIVSHEYLDIRWTSIRKFIAENKPLYEYFLDKVELYLERKTKKDKK
mgnify:FL=1